jgi:hypothetical protein
VDAQERWELFEDQYKLTMPFESDRGVVILLEIKDSALRKKTGRAGALYVLIRRQGISYVDYILLRGKILRKLPSKSEIRQFARENDILK